MYHRWTLQQLCVLLLAVCACALISTPAFATPPPAKQAKKVKTQTTKHEQAMHILLNNNKAFSPKLELTFTGEHRSIGYPSGGMGFKGVGTQPLSFQAKLNILLEDEEDTYIFFYNGGGLGFKGTGTLRCYAPWHTWCQLQQQAPGKQLPEGIQKTQKGKQLHNKKCLRNNPHTGGPAKQVEARARNGA